MDGTELFQPKTSKIHTFRGFYYSTPQQHKLYFEALQNHQCKSGQLVQQTNKFNNYHMTDRTHVPRCHCLMLRIEANNTDAFNNNKKWKLKAANLQLFCHHMNLESPIWRVGQRRREKKSLKRFVQPVLLARQQLWTKSSSSSSWSSSSSEIVQTVLCGSGCKMPCKRCIVWNFPN